jgi:hypothetical protein
MSKKNRILLSLLLSLISLVLITSFLKFINPKASINIQSINNITNFKDCKDIKYTDNKFLYYFLRFSLIDNLYATENTNDKINTTKILVRTKIVKDQSIELGLTNKINRLSATYYNSYGEKLLFTYYPVDSERSFTIKNHANTSVLINELFIESEDRYLTDNICIKYKNDSSLLFLLYRAVLFFYIYIPIILSFIILSALIFYNKDKFKFYYSLYKYELKVKDIPKLFIYFVIILP